jgi:hypothetical protein
MAQFSALVDATFMHLGVDATFTPEGGAPLTVRIIIKTPSEVASLFDTGLKGAASAGEVRVSEVATPSAGDQMTLSGHTYLIRQAQQDELGLVWRLDLDKQ